MFDSNLFLILMLKKNVEHDRLERFIVVYSAAREEVGAKSLLYMSSLSVLMQVSTPSSEGRGTA